MLDLQSAVARLAIVPAPGCMNDPYERAAITLVIALYHYNVLVHDDIALDQEPCRLGELRFMGPKQGKYRLPESLNASSNPFQSLGESIVLSFQ